MRHPRPATRTAPVSPTGAVEGSVGQHATGSNANR